LTGKTVALVGRSLTQMDGRPKYMNYPRGASLPLIPAKVKPINGRVILVEGIFDALNLWDKGLKNTICCFGTQKVDWVKLSLLKLQGVQGIDIVFDRDDAGKKAAQQIKVLAESMDIAVQVITLPESIDDPGNMTLQQIKGLKKRLYG
jgi:DNA primase